jgi:hypothetical protein
MIMQDCPRHRAGSATRPTASTLCRCRRSVVPTCGALPIGSDANGRKFVEAGLAQPPLAQDRSARFLQCRVPDFGSILRTAPADRRHRTVRRGSSAERRDTQSQRRHGPNRAGTTSSLCSRCRILIGRSDARRRAADAVRHTSADIGPREPGRPALIERDVSGMNRCSIARQCGNGGYGGRASGCFRGHINGGRSRSGCGCCDGADDGCSSGDCHCRGHRRCRIAMAGSAITGNRISRCMIAIGI